MTYFRPRYMTREKSELLLEWIKAEGLDPDSIADNGKFSVHNGNISGHKFIQNENGEKAVFCGGAVKVPFRVAQKNPLPEELSE